ncbi:hypothetical protein FRC02_006151 [Tulasnella sp. 418]|nr:hypothetical protein FRC02_006151 [Tulasnella sp. 418]
MDCPFSEDARIKYKDLQASLRAFLKEVDIKDGLATISLALSLSENHISSDELTARMIRAQAHPPILQFPGFEIHKEPPTPGELQRLSFIDKLPNEILFDILEICWKCYEIEQDQIHAHKTLELVCHRWLGITRSSPVLFSRTSIHRNSRIILHSNNAPLTIIGPLYNNLFMELIKPSYQRWRSLESNCRYGNDNTAQYFNIPAPILKSFKVKLSSENAVHLFAGQAPQLQYLEIPSMVIRWDLNILRGLRTLHIMAWDGFEVPSNTKMRQVLQACPDLQELHLIGRQGLSFPGSGPAPLDDVTTRIPLPHLRQLRLFHLPLNTLRCLLASINAPPFDEVWVEITTPSESALLQAFDGLPHDNALINAIRPSSKTHLLLGGYDAVWIQLRSRLPESDIYEPRLRIRGGGRTSLPLFVGQRQQTSHQASRTPPVLPL